MVRRLPPLNALRAFEAAARSCSFSKAAEELNVTATAISHQVKALEEFLDEDLFERLPRGLRLTPAGQALLPDLSQGFSQLARAEARLIGLRCSDMTGLLSISTVPAFGHCWLTPRLGKFRQEYPQIDIRLHTSSRQVDFLREGFDLAIRYGRGDYPGHWSQLLMHEEVFPAASPALLNGPIPLSSVDDLKHHTLLHDYDIDKTYEQSISWEKWLIWAGVTDTDPQHGLFYDNSASMVSAAVRGHGVVLARTSLVEEYLRDGRLVALFGVSRPTDFSYYLVAPESTVGRPRVQTFISWIVQEVAESAVPTLHGKNLSLSALTD